MTWQTHRAPNRCLRRWAFLSAVVALLVGGAAVEARHPGSGSFPAAAAGVEHAEPLTIAAIVKRGDDPARAPVHADAVRAIAGKWQSNWGPMTLEAHREKGKIVVAGGWVQGPGMHGIVTRGTFDPVRGVLSFEFDEPWHDRTGTATLVRSKDGRSFSGTWTFTKGGSGTWRIYRGNEANEVAADELGA